MTDKFGRVGPCMEARMMLALKTMAYGVPPHMLRDQFQMSVMMARKCCIEFDNAIHALYDQEYLRLPTKQDIVAINKLHKVVHGFDGMFGSLDCMHTYWKNCPMAWQGSYKGKEKKPSIVLEAICDFQLWFWLAAYGYAGTMNDINIWEMSPFLANLIDGSFIELEKEVVPYQIGKEKFKFMFILVDGIYPHLCRFVHCIKEAMTEKDKNYTAWQEGSRKDIERAFGVFKGKWQCLARPMHQINLQHIGQRVTACIILHNMCVSDRVMDGDVRAWYNPANSLEEFEKNAEIDAPEMVAIQRPIRESETTMIGCSELPPGVIKEFARTDRWRSLNNAADFKRIHLALLQEINKQKKKRKQTST
jgi:Plant transposon protein